MIKSIIPARRRKNASVSVGVGKTEFRSGGGGGVWLDNQNAVTVISTHSRVMTRFWILLGAAVVTGLLQSDPVWTIGFCILARLELVGRR